MPAMKCHYEVLGVERSASDGDIKKAYRRLALKYHPDKNQDNVEECTRLFAAIQQAYEVLCDPQERAWYDKHREDILRGAGSDFKDDSLNLMPYFSTSCFTGYRDDKEGFYSVYADVFHRINEEEVQYMDEGEMPLPLFGDSNSDYETVVHVFYSYWQSFSTHKSFAWEDQHDLRHAPNRRVQRLMEKENKKLREAGKKKTNETVRALVAFVRKRDKRVLAYKTVMEEKELLRQQRVAEKRAKDRQKRLKLQEEYEKTDHAHSQASSMFEEELQSLQARLDDEFGKDSDSSGLDSDGGQQLEDLFCPACNKLFKTDKAFANHQRSKKHRENATLLRKLLEEEELAQNQTPMANGDVPGNQNLIDDSQSDDSIEDELELLDLKDDNVGDTDLLTSSDVRSKPDDDPPGADPDLQTVGVVNGSGSESDKEEDPLPLLRNVKQGRGSVHLLEDVDHPHTQTPQASSKVERSTREGPSKGKRKGKKKSTSSGELKVQQEPLNYCNVCKSDFPSRNKLFQHIKDSGHAVHISDGGSAQRTKKSGRRKK